ncbi:MAG TPA: HD domain-containing phosphohydrolase [Vicinamibacteria bacterium]|jgi:HD-GYP domain-containing protein (c-di-GMP phosphodiesterase class II)
MAARKLAILASLSEAVRVEMQPVLSELGLAMVCARDDVEVLRLLGGEGASLVLAEASGGSDLCVRLRQDESTRNLPIVLIGGEGGREGRLTALRAGADEFFGAPVDQEDARLRLSALLRRAGLHASANGGNRKAEPPAHATNVVDRRALYDSTIAELNRVLGQIKNERPPDLAALRERALPLVQSTEGSEEMVALALGARRANDLATHHVNVTILGLAIARQLELPKRDLERYALLSLVHDLGMARIPESILSAPRRLTREEFQRITEHPGHTREILREAGSQYHDIADIAYQEHEREMGQGYPLGLRGEKIDALAKIVAVADVYEACTHARTYRKTFIPYEALQELIEMRGQYFHPRYIKALMNALTVYPLGSYVQLNTGETGRVLATNRTNLMRPVVELLWNARGERLGTPKMVDLAKTPFLFVSKPLAEDLLPRS